MGKIIKVARREELLTRDYIDNLAVWLHRTPESRRGVVRQGTDVFYAHHAAGGRLLTGEGEPMQITPGFFDEVHSECSEGEWVSEMIRRGLAKRAPRMTLLGRLWAYDALSLVCGRPIIPARRRAEVADMRRQLGRFGGVWKARYVNEMRKLRKAHNRETALLFGAEVRRLRLRLAAELDLWEAQR